MRNPIRADYERIRRLAPRRVVTAAGRKGRVSLEQLAGEIRARIRGTGIGEQELCSACRPDAGDPEALLADGSRFFILLYPLAGSDQSIVEQAR